MNTIKKLAPGLLVCAGITIPAWFLGNRFPIIGGPIMAILMGMVLCLFITDRTHIVAGINFTSKKILQTAVVLLGFGLDLHVIAKTGLQSLPIIICTIGISLLIAYVLHRLMKASATASMLVGVGFSICGGSAIAATASVIDADDEEIAQAISVIFFFNVIAALVFPPLGHLLGFDTTGGEAFGIFAGTAVNDTSSVTATAATWDSMWHLGTATLNKAVTVKLTRTLAIIPITLVIAFLQTKKMRKEVMTAESTTGNRQRKKVSIGKIFPMFILYFVIAALITTVAGSFGVSSQVFLPLKELSKIFIIMAMAAVGLNTNIVKLIKTGGKPIFIGLCCWVGITCVSLLMQHAMNL